MNLTFINRTGNRHLILIMAGWAMDHNPFAGISYAGYDIAVTWDYRDDVLDYETLASYREIVVIAWSMGVMECERTVAQSQLPVTLAIAVNGTPTPVDDVAGIPLALFKSTLEGLSEDNLMRFNRRVCGSGAAYREFAFRRPQRDIMAVTEELAILGQRAYMPQSETSGFWDLAIIGSSDHIFAPGTQHAAWKHVPTLIVDQPHLPDFMDIINRFVVNKGRVGNRFDVTRNEYDMSASIQHKVAHDLISHMLEYISCDRCFDLVIEIGSGGGTLTREYFDAIDYGKLELWDLSPNVGNLPRGAVPVADDAEARLMELAPGSINLMLSASTLQWFNSPCKALRNIAYALATDGIAAISFYTSGTFSTLSSQLGVSLNYIDAHRLIDSVPCDCEILYMSTDCHVQHFDSTGTLLRFLKSTGVDAAGHAKIATLRRVLSDDSLKQLEYNSTTIIIRKNEDICQRYRY
ncbi:MAG: DUF452 family protein [Clostridiales bacterium]|nr:DUF452 family protein [Clostridiales bacterium]